MNTKYIMMGSAVMMGVAGIAFTFFPQEILEGVALDAKEPAPVFIQAAGALYLGFAMMNWISKKSLIGGI